MQINYEAAAEEIATRFRQLANGLKVSGLTDEVVDLWKRDWEPTIKEQARRENRWYIPLGAIVKSRAADDRSFYVAVIFNDKLVAYASAEQFGVAGKICSRVAVNDVKSAPTASPDDRPSATALCAVAMEGIARANRDCEAVQVNNRSATARELEELGYSRQMSGPWYVKTIKSAMAPAA